MKRLSLIPALLVIAASLHADDFTTLGGEKYTNATVKRVEPDGIVVMYDDGVKKLQFTNLPPDVGKNYGFDPKKAEQFQKLVTAAALKSQSNAIALQDQEKTDFDTWEPFSSAVQNQTAWPGLTVDQTKQLLEVFQTKFRSQIESGKIDRNAVHQWINDVWNHQVCVGMPSDLVKLSWGEPSTVNSQTDADSHSEQWCYDAGYSKGAFLYVEGGVVTSIQN